MFGWDANFVCLQLQANAEAYACTFLGPANALNLQDADAGEGEAPASGEGGPEGPRANDDEDVNIEGEDFESYSSFCKRQVFCKKLTPSVSAQEPALEPAQITEGIFAIVDESGYFLCCRWVMGEVFI